MYNPKIGIDMDSVLNNLEEVWLNSYNEIYKDSLKLSDITEWSWHKVVKKECGEKIYDLLKVPSLFQYLSVKKNAIEVVSKLIRKNYDIYVVSASYPENILDKAKWLRKHFPFIDEDKYCFMNHKELLSSLDFLIDDGPHNIEKFPNKIIAFDAPYNQKINRQDVIRVKNWDEIGSYFNVL